MFSTKNQWKNDEIKTLTNSVYALRGEQKYESRDAFFSCYLITFYFHLFENVKIMIVVISDKVTTISNCMCLCDTSTANQRYTSRRKRRTSSEIAIVETAIN